jgi:CRISPR-associated protein Cas1
MKTKYIFSRGEIKRKDNSIAFRGKDKKWIYLPIKGLREIYFLNEVSLNSRLLSFASKNRIVFHFFGYFGNYIGSFYPKKQLISGDLTIRQSLIYLEKRTVIAKAIVKAIASNIYEVLYHYYRHGKKELKPTLDWINNDAINFLDNDLDIKQILFIEGKIWQKFYDSFELFLPKDFLLNKRVKRPPNNPMNALIGFGNSMLYTKAISAIYRTHLNQSISFLHSPSDARFSLSLDLSEAFKPIIVFKTIFELVNRKKLQVSKHFNKEVNYSLLNDSGKKIFLEAFENRLKEKFMHSKLNRYVSYHSAIKYDGYKLIKFILEGKEFMPFLLKEKQ